MRIFYWYVIKKFFSTFVFTLMLFIMIAIIFDISEKIDDFIEKDAPVEAIIFDYYFNFIPYFINLFSPLFIFISAIYFTSRMAYNTEIVAMISSGFNFYKLLVPYFTVGAVLALFSYYLNGWVIPENNKNLVEFEINYLKRPFFNDEVNIHRRVAENDFIYLKSYDFQDSLGFKFTYEKFDDEGNLTYKMMADKVYATQKEHQWRLVRYELRELDGTKETFTTGDTLIMEVPMNHDDFGRRDLGIKALTNKELKESIEREKMRGDVFVNMYIVEQYQRVSMPFATFVLILIALAISSKKVRGGMGLHLGLGLIIAFTYILLMQFSATFAINTNIPKALAVWTPNILYGILGIYLLRKTPK